MSSDNIKSPSSPRKKETNKRPLSEISPNIPQESKIIGIKKKRRNSLGFEMVSIHNNGNNFKSKIPQLSNSLNSSSGSSSGSTSTSTSGLVSGSSPSLLSIPQGILSIQERLKRKSAIRSNFNNSGNVKSVVISSTSQLSELQEEYYSLNESYKRQAQFLENQMIELNKLKRIFKNIYYKIEKLTKLINEKNIHLELIEEDLISFIEQEEQLINLKIKEYEMKLNTQFKELEFEMINELEDAKKFDFNEFIENIENLNKKKNLIKVEVENLKQEIKQKLNNEKENFKFELKNKINPLIEKNKVITNELDNKKKQFEEIISLYDEEQNKLIDKTNCITNVKQEISKIEQIMNNYQTTKKSLEFNLDQIDQQLRNTMNKDSEEQENYNIIHSEYSNLRNKIFNHDNHRRILENSIMEHQGKFRVYGIGCNNNLFNKSFINNTSSRFIIEEFQCLIKSVTKKQKNQDICIINNYLSGGSIVINSFKNFKTSSSIYQCISIKNKEIFDLLNSNLSVDNLFQHQKMIINNNNNNNDDEDDFNQFKQIVENLDSTISQELVIHIISNDFNKFILIDCSRIEINEQKDLLLKFINNNKNNYSSSSSSSCSLEFLDILLNWIYKNCSTLFLFEAKDQEIINSLNTINSIDIPSK